MVEFLGYDDTGFGFKLAGGYLDTSSTEITFMKSRISVCFK